MTVRRLGTFWSLSKWTFFGARLEHKSVAAADTVEEIRAVRNSFIFSLLDFSKVSSTNFVTLVMSSSIEVIAMEDDEGAGSQGGQGGQTTIVGVAEMEG